MLHSRGRFVISSFLRLTLPLAAVSGIAWAQAVSTNPPPRSAGFSLPYKKDGRTMALFTGSRHKPLSVTLVRIWDFRAETYNADGTPSFAVESPECLLDISTRQVNSDGPLKITQSGGGFTLSGVGFAWDQEAGRLQISNRVEATFQLNARPANFLNRP